VRRRTAVAVFAGIAVLLAVSTIGAPIVLLHCFACSLHRWDRVVPLLERRHRVVRLDLLGFGGPEKPKGPIPA
jgi:pimeloyl-ACP methyl ester carboxylesterase